jgi:hypothetical protein
MRYFKSRASKLFLFSFFLYLTVVHRVLASTTDEEYNHGSTQIDNEEAEEMTSSVSGTETQNNGACYNTSGPRLRDAIRYKFKRGNEAIMNVGKRGRSEAKKGYYSAKMETITKGAKFLVDYGVKLKSYAYIIRNSGGEKWRNSDLEVIQNAISASLKPLKTYQQALQKGHKKKLGQSVKELFRLLRNKPINYTIKEGDWEKGKIHSSVFRRFDIQDLFLNRDNVLSLRPDLTEDLLAIENRKLSEGRKYFKKKEGDSWKFRKYISNNLDWSGFESRYFEVVTKLLIADPCTCMAKEARHYLAIYLFTGDAQDYKYRSMMNRALKNREQRAFRPTQTWGSTSGTLTKAATVTVTVKQPSCATGISEVSRIWQFLIALLIPLVLSLSTMI